MILVIGQQSLWQSLGRALPPKAELRFAQLEDVTADLIDELDPELVICRLIDAGFDASEVGQRLAAAGYRRSLRAVCPSLPNPEAVRAEIRRAAAGIDFDLVMVPSRLS